MSADRRWAWPFVPAYGAALAAANLLRAAGLPRQKRLQWPVVSVGSLSAGGAGKTPVVLALATLLRERGWVVDVLSRGYGRKDTEIKMVDPRANDAALHFGDEPVLIAERTGIPVWVGKSRWAAGRKAEAEASEGDLRASKTARNERRHRSSQPPRVHLLDDGMQHRRLRRDFELVLVTGDDLGDTLLPAGNLREPLGSLRRADAFAVREDEVEKVSTRLRELGRTETPVWTLRRTLRFPAPLGVFTAGLRPLAFCGLARPEGFASALMSAGCGIIDTVVFPDHHRYSERDIATLCRMASRLRATGLVTTEKDAVKLSPVMRSHLEAEVGPLMVVPLDTTFVYESPVMRALETKLRRRHVEEPEPEARLP